jgi:signal transduction histidine kinase
LIDQVPLPLLRFNPAEGLLAVNRAARNLFQTDELIVDPPVSLLDAINRTGPEAGSSLVVFGRTYAVGISEYITAKDTIRLVSLTDIQSEIRVAEATALRDLLRVLSHEIMNSLTPVANLAGIAHDYLQDETSPASQAARDALALLSERAVGLERFVDAYRSMAKLPEPVIHPVALGPLLRDVVLVFEHSLSARTVSIELDLPPDCPPVDADETLLTQALLNVLTNAAEATAATPGPRRIRVSVVHDVKDVRIFISDNGCGVPDSLVEQIFHAFVTTKPNGTGTGLNLARQIALAHGGDLIFLGAQDSWSAVFAFILRVSPTLLDVD